MQAEFEPGIFRSKGFDVDGEHLTNVSFADDVALFHKNAKQMERHFSNLNLESLKVGVKMRKGKTKYTKNYTDSEGMHTKQEKKKKKEEKKRQNSNTSYINIANLKDTTKQ